MTRIATFVTQERFSPIPFARLHFWVVLASYLCIALGSTPGYRIGAQLNVVLVLLTVWYLRKQQRHWQPKIVAGMLVCALFFVLLNFVALGNVAGDRSLPRILYAVFLAMALALLPASLPTLFRQQVIDRAAWLAGAYVLIQLAALFFLKQFPACAPCSGTTSNPHYLALFTLYTLPVLLHKALTARGLVCAVMCAFIVIAFFLLVQTSSRPAWIAVFAAALLWSAWLKGTARYWSIGAAIAFPWMFYLAGPNRFRDRVDDLIANISREERVAIWTDAWQMQVRESDLGSWLWGHGLDSYFEAFKAYSTFHGIRDFAFPHNFFLELLYLSGVTGLLAATMIYAVLIQRFWRSCQMAGSSTPVAQIAVLATFSAASMHSFLVFPFFSHYNLVILSLGAGVFAYQLTRKGETG